MIWIIQGLQLFDNRARVGNIAILFDYREKPFH